MSERLQVINCSADQSFREDDDVPMASESHICSAFRVGEPECAQTRVPFIRETKKGKPVLECQKAGCVYRKKPLFLFDFK